MDRDEIQRLIGRLRFGDGQHIRIKNLLADGEGTASVERVEAWLDDALRRLGDCPPEALARWAEDLGPVARAEARKKVEALRGLVLAMDLFLERAAARREDSEQPRPEG